MVSFIQRVDDPEIPPPYKFPGVTIMSFQLPAKLANLQKLCNRLLNIGSLADRGFEYRAFTDFVDMEIVTYPKMMFDQLPYSQWGYATQQELYFRFYVWRFNLFGGLLFPELFPQLCFPFIYVDNSWSMISGRNVIGYPKVMAQFNPTPMLGTNPLQITASALAMETHSPNTELKMHPIVEINPSQAAPALPNGIWPWVGLAAQDRILDPNLQQQSQTFLAEDPNLFSTVQLKQFRDLPTGACFQAVVETPFTPSNIGVPQPLPPVSVTVNSYASLDIPGSLGLPAGVALQPALQYSLSLDMSMQNGSDLFINS
jgi:acetoacetate decarboxylase